MRIKRLNIHQIDRLSEIVGNLGLIFFASLVLPILAGELIIRIPVVISGITFTIACFFISLFLLKGGAKMSFNWEGLQLFYLTGAILLLVIAIILYPTLKNRSKK